MNNLSNETSPYLLQHADNPVNWYPWGEEALTLAKQENKPILLSIGYSACHWCHVMAHESFEDEDTANLMNKHFINIKVDREERPDIDKIYQTAQQLLTQRNGGWPLTMFLTPGDQLPFFGGTYFPLEPRFGLPGFRDILQRIVDYYVNEYDAITTQNKNMQQALERISTASEPSENPEILDRSPIDQAVIQLQQHFDQHHGGFSQAPKFPHPTSLELLLRNYVNRPDQEDLLKMVTYTLVKMANGGIYDQIGGGFCRYSVDESWTIPHFEKMLYDNGPLLALYSQCWQIEPINYFRDIARETADWIIRDMQSPQGGYYSTLDADSEGEEGKFYVWTRETLQDVLNEQEYQVAEIVFGLNLPANFEGQWHLRIHEPLITVVDELNIQKEEAEQILDRIKSKLLEARNKRIWPGRDEKILTSWNALMIKGMATAAYTFQREDYFKSACKALDFIIETLWQDGRLLATCKDGKAHLNAYLDDYAFLIEAILKLLQYRWHTGYLNFAIQLADCLLDNFEDKDQGGFFFTSHDHEKLIQRNKPLMDDALPSGNGIAALSLAQLGHLIGEQKYLDACEGTLQMSWASMKHYPSAYNALLFALDEYLSPPKRIILCGPSESLATWEHEIRLNGSPYNQIYILPGKTHDLPGILAEYKIKQEVTAYICQGHQCLAPLTRLDLLKENLNN